MSEYKKVCELPTKCCPNEYIRDIKSRHGVLKSSNESPLYNNPTSQVTAENIDIPIMNGNNRLYSINSLGVSNAIPQLPNRNPSLKNFVKGKPANSEPLPIPTANGDGHWGRNLPESHRRKARFERSASDYVPETEMKTIAVKDNDNEGYLTPADPPPYTGSSLGYGSADFPSSPTGSETSTNSFQKQGKPGQRVDSGLGDCESGQGLGSVRFSTSPSCSSNSMHNPRLSTQYEQQYEDIDQYNRALHPQQQSCRQQPQNAQKLGMGNILLDLDGGRQRPHASVSGVTTSDTEDNDLPFNTSMAEAILQPMHDPRTGSLPHAYMPLSIKRHSQASRISVAAQKGGCWHIILAILIVLLISLTALSLSIYILVSKSERNTFGDQGTTPVPSDLGETLSTLQDQVDSLMKKNADLEVLLMQKYNLTTHVKDEVNELSSKQDHFDLMLQSMESKFEAQIANITLRPGPRGLPGVANFSLCTNQSSARSGLASSTRETYSPFLPSRTEKQDYFVIFAYCTYDGATNANLEMQLDSTSNRQVYRCKCWGHVEGKTHTLCKVNALMCP